MQTQLLRHTGPGSYGFDADTTAQRAPVAAFSVPSQLTRGTSGPNPDGTPREREPFPNYFSQVHGLLNTPDGRPTLAFYLIEIGVGVQIPHFIAGSFFTPGLSRAVHENDSLTLVFIACVSIFMALQVYGFTILRTLGRQGGPLDVLGVGVQPLSRESLRTLRRAHKLLFPTQPLAAAVPLCGVLISLLVIVFGMGIQSSLWNRVSAGVWICWPLVAGPICLSWVFSLTLAVTHCRDAVQLVVDEINPLSQAPQASGHRATVAPITAERWSERVLTPTRALARKTIPELSRGWSQIQGLCIVACFVAAIGIFSLSLSPLYWAHVHESLAGWDAAWIQPMILGVHVVIYGLMVRHARFSWGSSLAIYWHFSVSGVLRSALHGAVWEREREPKLTHLSPSLSMSLSRCAGGARSRAAARGHRTSRREHLLPAPESCAERRTHERPAAGDSRAHSDPGGCPHQPQRGAGHGLSPGYDGE